jgi:hypothetical protein
MVTPTKAARMLQYALKGYTPEQIKILEEAEFQNDLSRIKTNEVTTYIPGLTDEMLHLENMVYQRHFKLVQAFRLNRSFIKEKTGADVDPDKWDFTFDNHQELVEHMNDSEEEFIRYADAYVLQKASYFFKVAESDLKIALTEPVSELRKIFRDDFSYKIALQLFDFLEIEGKGETCSLTERKAGILVAAIESIISKKLLNTERDWSIYNAYTRFQDHFKISYKSSPKIGGTYYTNTKKQAAKFFAGKNL